MLHPLATICLVAQVPTAPADDIAKVLLALMALVVIAERGVNFWRLIQSKPPTADFERMERLINAVDQTSKERRDASKAEILAVRNDIETIRRDHSDMLDRRFGSLERRIEGLDNRLADVLTVIAKYTQSRS